jgi:hypothetical protein
MKWIVTYKGKFIKKEKDTPEFRQRIIKLVEGGFTIKSEGGK